MYVYNICIYMYVVCVLVMFLSHCSLHGLSELELLISSCSSLPSPLYGLAGSHTSLPGWKPVLINLQQLQEDVFAKYVAGKPLIGPPQSLRTNFAFRDARHTKEKYDHVL